MDHFVHLGGKSAGFHAGFGADGCFHESRVKTHAVVVDEVFVHPADARQAPVFAHGHKVVGVQILFVADLIQREECLIVDLSGADGGGGEEQNACAGAVREVKEFLFRFIIDLYVDAGERVTDGAVVTLGRGDDTGPADLRQTVPDGNSGAAAASGDQFVIPPL